MMSLWFLDLLKIGSETIKNNKQNLLKNNRSLYISILLKLKQELTSLPGFHNRVKNDSEIFLLSCSKIW